MIKSILTVTDGLCVQCMHIGSYDDEPATVTMMHEFMEQQGNEYIEVVNDVIFNELCLGNALVGARAGKSDIFEI